MTLSRVTPSVLLRSFVVCEVGEALYVLPVEEVQEIIQPLPLTSLPHAPPGIIGAVEHRETVVPVLDLSLKLGYGKNESYRAKWVLLRGHGRVIGLVVSRVLEVFEVRESALRPAPDVGDVAARAAHSVLNYRGGMAFVLDMDSVAALADVRLEVGQDQ